MKTHNIKFESFIPTGKISLKIDNGELFMTSKIVLGIGKQKFAAISDKFKLPFRIDMTLKANSSDFKLLIGKGGLHFSAPINHSGGGIRRYDILTGKEEPVKHDRDNDVPLNKYVDLAIVYGSKITWVEINNNYCYFTRNAPYLSLLEGGNLPDEFADGLDFAVSCGRNVELTIKSLTVTEYENNELDIPAEIANVPELSPFEWYVKSLPPELRNEVIKIDEYLLKDMKNSLRFRRTIDKYGYVIYNSFCGFQYKMYKFGIIGDHETAGEHQINWELDYITQILNKLAELSPKFADKMFSKLKVCNTPSCKKGNSIIEFKGDSKKTCGGKISFTWLPSEFDDVKKVVKTANEVMKMVGKNK